MLEDAVGRVITYTVIYSQSRIKVCNLRRFSNSKFGCGQPRINSHSDTGGNSTMAILASKN